MPRLSKIGAACLAAFGWTSGVSAVTASYLVVAGGGGGGSRFGGGGGAGGLLSGTSSLNPTVTYTVTVGAGGTGGPATGGSGTAGASDGSNGADSVFNAVTSIGGGGGGAGDSRNGLSGGSGGGGAGRFATSGGSATSGQGNAGGGSTGSGPNYYGGGGGGAGAAGNGGSNSVAPGGIGLTSSITGTSTYYAGGGGGAGDGTISAPGSNGGLGGGGAGGITAGTAGTSNTGGGGGGGGNGPGSGNSPGGNGGSGVVIVSYPAPQLFWGGFVTTSGGNVIHTFTTSGSLAPITTSVTANYLQVAGGGGGGYIAGGNRGAGGGAGGLLSGTTSLSLASSYTVTVGAGGSPLTNGSNSQFGALIASVGGGAGGCQNGASAVAGSDGGSGGGGPSQAGSGSNAAGSGTSGQGYAGAAGTNAGGQPYGCGGGGGAGGAGSLSNNPAGAGGVGVASSITGTSVYYAGGGGGGTYGAYPGAGGAGGNGGGGTGGGSGGVASNGTANLGGGGGGAEYSQASGASGGSGVVIISYPGSQLFGGGVVTYNGTNTVHTFNTSGTLIPIVSLSASYLIVAGGAGASGGGGGAGGFLSGAGVTIDTNSTYLVTVGAGGIGQDPSSAGTNGGNSTFSLVPTTAIGGGGGGHFSNSAANNGNSGGSGGGGGGSDNSGPPGYGASGTGGQGNRGGDAVALNTSQARGGGGGAGAAGANGSSSTGGAGGVGLTSSLSGTSTYYAGGGGGGSGNSTNAAGGNGGGGAGGQAGSNGTAGTANTGGGGGGSGSVSAATGGNGGSGVVIISYPGSTQLMAGGTVTISGGNVIHTFNNSGYLSPLKFVGNSLRFRGSNSATLTRTVTTASPSTKATFSLWAKKGKDFDSNNNGCFAAGADSYYYAQWYQQGLYFGNTTYWMNTAAVYRDYAAWYHIVFVIDTTLATSTDRLQIWVNGVRQTAGGVTSYPPQNASFPFLNTAQLWYIGGRSADGYLDGYLSEVNFVDGQALTPNAFGTFNSYGVWQPITYGGSYGTNGFYLPFNANAANYAGVLTAGSNQYLNVASNAAFQFGTGDFTIEMYVYHTNSGSQTTYWGDTSGPSAGIYFYRDGSNKLSIYTTGLVVASGASIPANQWVHVAVSRSSSTLRLFINGQVVATITDSTNLTDSNCNIGNDAGNSAQFVGYMSNVRVVKGTALYTANFIPSTTNLTNVSGTSLLTLQNASIVDNSSNGFTVNNTGSVTTSNQLYPFAWGIFNDQSSAGNNWTANNISGAIGTTMDYMTDVPTLTSATAANYATLNPLVPPTGAVGLTWSNGNLNLATINSGAPASESSSLSTMYFPPTGKFYAEMTVGTTLGTTSNAWPRFGVAGIGMGIGGYVNFGGSSYGTFATGDVMMVAWDASAGYIWWGKNGTWLNSGNPAAGTGYISTFAYDFASAYVQLTLFYSTTGSTASVNFGQQPFAYTVPTDFVALNTYNL